MKMRPKIYILVLLLLIIVSILFTFTNSDIQVAKSPEANNDSAVSLRKNRKSIDNNSIEIKENLSASSQMAENKPYILTCDLEQSMDIVDKIEMVFDRVIFNDTFEEIDKRIEDAEDFESRLAHLLGGSHLAEFNLLESLIQLRNESPSSKLLDWSILNECVNSPPEAMCGKELLNDIQNNLNSNSAAWLAYTAIAIRENNTVEINRALKNITVAPFFDEYYTETLKLFDRVLEKHGASTPFTRHVKVIGRTAGTMLPNHIRTINKFCLDITTDQLALDLLCLEAGKRISTSTKSLLYVSFGSSLQSIYYKKYNDEKSLELVKSQQNKLWYTGNKLWHKASALTNFDFTLMEFHVQNMMDHGEIKANMLLIEEAIRLSSDKDYDPCKF